MRRIVFLVLLFPFALSAQQDCGLFNIQDVAAENLVLLDSIANFAVDTIILQPDGSFEVQLSNGTTFIHVQGCTDTAYLEYNASANTDDGSCAIAVVEGCMDSAYLEYNASANTDDGSCSTAVVEGCTDPADVNYNASANTDDGSCASNWCSSLEFDGYTYSVVEIGDQCWFAENLRSTVFPDGTSIPEVPGLMDWVSYHQGPAQCVAHNSAGNLATYGRLYNWDAVNSGSGLCPSGWHVPTDGEWTDLEDYITSQGFAGIEGRALKSTSFAGHPSTFNYCASCNGTDDFGFTALPGGYRESSSGGYSWVGVFGYWWSSSTYGNFAWYRQLDGSPDIERDWGQKGNGFSVRCLRYE